MNGWWIAVHGSSASPVASNIGGSAIQRTSWRPSGIRPKRSRQLQAQRAERGRGRRLGVGDEEQQVAVGRLQLRVDRG